jgi:ribosomal-protein-alanine N-acetyltransferase
MAVNDYHSQTTKEHLFLTNDAKYSAVMNELIELDQRTVEPAWTSVSWSALATRHDYEMALIKDCKRGLIAFALLQLGQEMKHLLKIAVCPSARRMGYGHRLLALSLGDHDHCYLEVRDDNISAIGLYESFGFEKLHHAKRYYSCGAGAYKMMLGAG